MGLVRDFEAENSDLRAEIERLIAERDAYAHQSDERWCRGDRLQLALDVAERERDAARRALRIVSMWVQHAPEPPWPDEVVALDKWLDDNDDVEPLIQYALDAARKGEG